MVSLLPHLVIPKWAKWMSRLSQSASPIVLVIASSAVRGIQLSREASEFRSGCTTAKLFAKHLKVCMHVLLKDNVICYSCITGFVYRCNYINSQLLNC